MYMFSLYAEETSKVFPRPFFVFWVSLKRGTPAAEVFLPEILPPGLTRYAESISRQAKTINSTVLFLKGTF
jgi:hypothetical protein